MTSTPAFFDNPFIMLCPVCGKDISIAGLADKMEYKITACWEIGEEHQYSFITDVITECAECQKRFKITGSIWDYPEEYSHTKISQTSHTLKLLPLDD